MKRYFNAFSLVLLATAGFSAGCAKETASPESAKADLLVGRWELIQTDGGLTGRLQPADPACKQEMVFSANNQVSFLLNGAVTSTTTYSLAQADSYVKGQPQTFLTYSTQGMSDERFIERISSTDLVLVQDYADGQGFYYKRR